MRRPWPTPIPEAPDFVLRTPAQVADLIRRAIEGPLPLEAAARLDDHRVAVEAMADLAEVLDGYRTFARED